MTETSQQAGTSRHTQILEAAARVFAEKGFHGATVRDVARAAGVADGTIYNYFEGKTALLLGLFELMTERTRLQVMPALLAEDDPRTFLRMLVAQPLAALSAGNLELFRVVVSEVLVDAELAGRFLAQIQAPMLTGHQALLARLPGAQQRPPEEAELLVRTISSLILGLVVQRVMGDEVLAERWDEMPDLLTDLLLNGLSGERA